MGLIRNVFPPLVHPLKKSCNTQTSFKFDKTSTSNNLCSQSSATTLFPPSSLHADRLKKSKHTTFKSTGLGGLVTLFSSESNFSNDMFSRSTGAACPSHPQQLFWLQQLPHIKMGPKEILTTHNGSQKRHLIIPVQIFGNFIKIHTVIKTCQCLVIIP